MSLCCFQGLDFRICCTIVFKLLTTHAAAAIRSRLVPHVGSPARSPGIGSPGNPGSIARDPGSIAREPNPIPTPGTEFDPQGLGRLHECKTGNPWIPGWWKTARIYFYGLLRVPNWPGMPATPPLPGLLGTCSAELQHPAFFYILYIKANVAPKRQPAAGTHDRP